MTNSEVHALISLLDDTDKEVVEHVTTRLREIGRPALPILEDRYLTEKEEHLQKLIYNVIDDIQQSNLMVELDRWLDDGALDLFEGIYLINRIQYPELKREHLNNAIDQLRLDAWLELNFQLAPLDKVRILNHTLYEQHGFRGNTKDYHSPDNSMLNRVLETRKGNPVSLAILYSIIAQRLGIPIFGVNLPQHFVLAYKDDSGLTSRSYGQKSYLSTEVGGDILFYINAFNRGAIFSKWNVEQFISQLNLKPLPLYYQPCSNVDILIRVLRNIIYSFTKLEREDKVAAFTEVLEHLIPHGSLNFEL